MVYFGCKFVPVYPTKAYRSRSLTPLIHNQPLDRSAWSASCLSRYAPGKRNLGTHWGWAELRCDLEIFGQQKNLLSLPGFEKGSSGTYPIQFPKYVISSPIFLTYDNYPSVLSTRFNCCVFLLWAFFPSITYNFL